MSELKPEGCPEMPDISNEVCAECFIKIECFEKIQFKIMTESMKEFEKRKESGKVHHTWKEIFEDAGLKRMSTIYSGFSKHFPGLENPEIVSLFHLFVSKLGVGLMDKYWNKE